MASTSDYYSLEVSPVSDMFSCIDSTHIKSIENLSRYKCADSRHASISSSGVGSTSTTDCFGEDGILDDKPFGLPHFEAEVKQKTPWQLFREHEKMVRKHDQTGIGKRKLSQNSVGRLMLHNPSLLDTLITEEVLPTTQPTDTFLTSTPKKISSMSSDKEPVQLSQKTFKPSYGSPNASAKQCTETKFQKYAESRGEFNRMQNKLPTIDTMSQLFAISPASATINQPATHMSPNRLSSFHSLQGQQTDRLLTQVIEGAKEYIPAKLLDSEHVDEQDKEQAAAELSGMISWKGKEIKHCGTPRYGRKHVVRPVPVTAQHTGTATNLTSRTTKVCIPADTVSKHIRPCLENVEPLSNPVSKHSISSIPMMDDQTSTSDLSSLVREYQSCKSKLAQHELTMDNLPQRSKTEDTNPSDHLSRTQRFRRSFRKSFKRLKKLVSAS